ncbi:class D sortase [Cytobacillus sp. Hz8]|uniref:class D sortase n=1 Tax=Cytobacillus sp. Hz8 TaxID=3347168 RepID=UPI0035E07B8A
MKKIGTIFILIGIVLFMFVIYTKGKTYFEQQKLIKEYTSLNFSSEYDEDSPKQLEVKKGDTIGILKISKINLKTPIVEGASQENIRYAVGHLPSSCSTTELGNKNQNFVIAGHRSYTYGKFFNRLDELKKGNKIIIYVQNRVLTYKVFKKKIVDPKEIDVINPMKGKSMVTLITCHPPYSDKQRLIIFSELESEKVLNGAELMKK